MGFGDLILGRCWTFVLSISREPGCATIGHFVGRRLGCACSEAVHNFVLGHILSISILIKDAIPACAGVEFADCAFILLGAKFFCNGGAGGKFLGVCGYRMPLII